MKIAKTEWNEGFKVLRERHTTGEMRFPPLVFTLSSLAEAALHSGSRSVRDESGRTRAELACHAGIAGGAVAVLLSGPHLLFPETLRISVEQPPDP